MGKSLDMRMQKYAFPMGTGKVEGEREIWKPCCIYRYVGENNLNHMDEFHR